MRPDQVRPPASHTTAELERLLEMLREADVDTIAVGHGRDPASVAAADALVAAWTGTVLTVVDWPAVAASWLRPARRLVAGGPDAWVIADIPAGCERVCRRLADQPDWTPHRTFSLVTAPCR